MTQLHSGTVARMYTLKLKSQIFMQATNKHRTTQSALKAEEIITLQNRKTEKYKTKLNYEKMKLVNIRIQPTCTDF